MGQIQRQLESMCPFLQEYDETGTRDIEGKPTALVSVQSSPLQDGLQRVLRSFDFVSQPQIEAAWSPMVIGVGANTTHPPKAFLIYEVSFRNPGPGRVEFAFDTANIDTQLMLSYVVARQGLGLVATFKEQPRIIPLPAGKMPDIVRRYASGKPVTNQEWLNTMEKMLDESPDSVNISPWVE